jgi:hypothetical protein
MINKSFLAIIGAAVLGLVLNTSQICVAQSRAQVRQQINIDRDWKFIRGDQAGAEVVAYNDQNWNNINIPHNFSEPYFQSEKWYTGYSRIRKLQVRAIGTITATPLKSDFYQVYCSCQNKGLRDQLWTSYH